MVGRLKELNEVETMQFKDNEFNLIVGIDPGTTQTAYVITLENVGMKILSKGIIENTYIYQTIESELLSIIVNVFSDQTSRDFKAYRSVNVYVALEYIESKGMPVGATTFETCYMIGQLDYRFKCEAPHHLNKIHKPINVSVNRIYRHEEKTAICGNSRAKDSNIRQALIDKYGIVGTIKNKGFFYGVKKDIWQAFAVAETFNIML